jgi:hypothetical protein
MRAKAIQLPSARVLGVNPAPRNRTGRHASRCGDAFAAAAEIGAGA